MKPSRLILHRLAFSAGEASFFNDLGVEIVPTRSVAATLREAAKGACVVVVDISVGSATPERIVRGIEEIEDHSEVAFLAVARKRGGAEARAARLGVDRAFLWPDGAFAELVRRLDAKPGVKMRRTERANVEVALSDPRLGFDGKLVNLSASGALIVCGAEGESLENLEFEVELGGLSTSFDARVIWRSPFAGGYRLGLQFRGLSHAARRSIEQFVREHNIVRARGKMGAAPRPRQGPTVKVQFGKRTDYYRLEGDLSRDALLVQSKAFFVPYGVGDSVIVRPPGREPVEALIQDHVILDPDKMDSRMGWRVVEKAEPVVSTTPTVIIEPTGELLSDIAAAISGGQDGTPDVEALRARFGDVLLLAPPGPGEGEAGQSTLSVYTLTIREDQHLLVFDARARVNVLNDSVTLGRTPDNDIVLAEPTVSSRHAELTRQEQGWVITDRGSSNGTAVDGRRLESGEPAPVTGAAPIFLGYQRLHILRVEKLAELITRLRPYLDPPPL